MQNPANRRLFLNESVSTNNSKKFTDSCLENFLEAVTLVWNAWQAIRSRCEPDDPTIVSEFFKQLGQLHSCRLFGLRSTDFNFLVQQEDSPWKNLCLNQIRSKIAIHLKLAIEAFEMLNSLGQLNSSKGNTGDADDIRHKIDQLGQMATWMEIYSRNGQRILEFAVKEDRFQNVFEISPIDTELFAACLLMESDSFENEETKIEIEKKIATAIEQNLFGTCSPVVRDSANLWWALKLSVQEMNGAVHPILDRLPGRRDDLQEKCIKILSLACLQEIATPAIKEHNKKVSLPHPRDYTPEIYTDQKTYAFVLLNALKIETTLSSNITFRRSPVHWHILNKIDEKIDDCWEKIITTDPKNLNLYLLSLITKVVGYWLVQCRTNKRWEHFMCSHNFDGQTLLECSAIAKSLNRDPLNGVVTNSSVFSEQIKTVRTKMEVFLRSGLCKHPFTIAICGPPGSGKTFLGKQLLKSLGVEDTIKTYNLASQFPNPGENWIETLGNVASSGTYEKHYFQAVIIDEADSLNPQRVSDNTGFAYQWLLEPLWEEWPKFLNDSSEKEAIPTFVFVIASRYLTWTKWYHDALKPNVSKGKDFVSRIDVSIDLPPMSPEDQLLMVATQLEAQSVPKITVETAKIIALATFENHGRSLETLKKQCKINEARESKYLGKEHLPSSGNFRPEALTMRSLDA